MKKTLLLLFFITSSCTVIWDTYISMVSLQIYEGKNGYITYTATFDKEGDFVLTNSSNSTSTTYILQNTSSNGVGTYKVGSTSYYIIVEINTTDGELYIYEEAASKNAALYKDIEYVLYKVEVDEED